MQFLELQRPRECRDLDLDLESGHTAYRRALLVDRYALCTYQMSLKSEKLFVDGRTDVPTDGRTFPL